MYEVFDDSLKKSCSDGIPVSIDSVSNLKESFAIDIFLCPSSSIFCFFFRQQRFLHCASPFQLKSTQMAANTFKGYILIPFFFLQLLRNGNIVEYFSKAFLRFVCSLFSLSNIFSCCSWYFLSFYVPAITRFFIFLFLAIKIPLTKNFPPYDFRTKILPVKFLSIRQNDERINNKDTLSYSWKMRYQPVNRMSDYSNMISTLAEFLLLRS